MYKLMIVDDEPEIREHIKNAIQWETLDLLLVDETGDADAALESAMLFHPQIVVMDICIPGKDGLSLAGELMQQDPELKVLIISGYQDFSYAQRAVSIGVSEYLTKPLVPRELNAALQQILDEFNVQKEHQRKAYTVNQVLEQNRLMLQQWHLKALFQSHMSTEEEQLKQQFQLLEIPFCGERSVVLLVCGKTDTWSTPDGGVQSAIVKQYLETRLQEEKLCVYSYFDDERVLNCLISAIGTRGEEVVEQVCKSIRNELKFYFGHRLFMGIGEQVCGLTQLTKSYQQAKHALQHSLMLSSDPVVSWFNIKETQTSDVQEVQILNRQWLPRVLECLREGQEIQLQGCIDQMCEQLQTMIELREFGVEFLSEASRLCGELGIHPWNTIDYPQVVRQFFDASDRWDFKDALLQLCEKLSGLFRQKDSDDNRLLIIKAKAFIEKNLTDKDLSLEQVSNHVGLSKAYFCSLFHKTEGMTFKNHLMALRIRYAKHLLMTTDKKIYEISCQVGCNDAAYFNRVFKRNTGMTPLQYRNGGYQD